MDLEGVLLEGPQYFLECGDCSFLNFIWALAVERLGGIHSRVVN